MGSDYRLTDDVELLESSCEVCFMIDKGDDVTEPTCSKRINMTQLREAIVKQIHVLSYYSEDPDEVLERFNVTYEDKL